MIEFSVFLAAIRPSKWWAFYESLKEATSREFELIFVGPYELPPELQNFPNVKCIQDYGCPTRCYQLGLLASTAPYIIFAADDGLFLKTGAIDNAFKTLESLPSSRKNIVSFKYYEGEIIDGGFISTPEHWIFGSHKLFRKLNIPRAYNLLMTGLINRDYLIELGGFDCQFDHLGLGCPDLAIRMQRDGANVVMGDYLFHVTWWPGHMEDHGPIHDSHNEHELPTFKRIYSNPDAQNRIKIDINNWRNVLAVWTRRFGNEIQGVDHPEFVR